MLNLSKVQVRDDSNEPADSKTSQGKYNKKVDDLRKACENFRESILSEEMESENSLKTKFNSAFDEQMKKNRIFSRTSKLLHKMSKELSKFKGPVFKQTKAKEYADAFKFKAKSSNTKGYIKRSAIDDKFIANFFNNEMIKIFKSRKAEMKAQSKIQEISTKAQHSLEKSDESIESANKIIEKINKTIEGINTDKISEKAKNVLIQHLNSTKTKLESAIKNATKQNKTLENGINQMEVPASKSKKDPTSDVQAQMQQNEKQIKQLAANAQAAETAVKQAEKESDQIEDAEHKEKIKEMEQAVKKTKDCYDKLKTEIEDPLSTKLISYCDEQIASLEQNKRLSEEDKTDIINSLHKEKAKEETLMETWKNAIKEPTEAFNQAKLYDNNTSIEDLDKKIGALKELVIKFNALIKEFKPKYDALNRSLEDVYDDNYY